MAIRANSITTPVSRVDTGKQGNAGGTAQSTSTRRAAGAARASVPVHVVKAEGGPPTVDFEQAGRVNQAVERMGQMSNELSSAKAALETGGQAGTITDAFGNEISMNGRSRGVARLSCMGDSTTDTWEDGHVADWRNRTSSDSGHTLDVAGSSRGQNPGSPLGRVMDTEETV